ncbi:hypothetical protein N7478_005362 [Penicillium angulare]|uniref:uncharacterized protein n=1 Tax=Penicillium angulare TaxID=116970 RepID=UPI00253FE1C5|nr:uncharacterized protein N7478_005362 [Penicillium angulare]KAJ5279990.1 hypothetical protein N7478_005362 [Penicillium angulare]
MEKQAKKLTRKSSARSCHGCTNCRRSKVKCDEQKPICTRCWQKDLHCSSPFQLKWESTYHDRGIAFGRSGLSGKNPPKKEQSLRPPSGSSSTFPKETIWLGTPAIQPWTFVNNDTPFIRRLCEEEQDHGKRRLLPALDAKLAIGEQGTHELVRPFPKLPHLLGRSVSIDEAFIPNLSSSPSLFPSLDQVGNRMLFDYYINQICPRTAHSSLSQSPFASVILPYCLAAPATVLRAIQALAACHWSQYDSKYSTISLRLKSRVLIDFRKIIHVDKKAVVANDPEILVIAMFLCLFDIVDHCNQQWIVHLQGAKDIIRFRRRHQYLTEVNWNKQQDDVSHFVELFFAFQDVMGRTACAKADIFGSSYWQEDDTAINSWMGCSPALVSILFSAMDLSRSRQHIVSNEDQLNFKINATALDNKLEHLKQELHDQEEDQTIYRVAELKRITCIVFLKCALFGGKPSDPAIKTYVREIMSEVFGLHALESACHVIWPLFVAAVELDPLSVELFSNPQTGLMTDGRRLVLELLEEMVKSTVSGISRIRVVVEQVWKARDFNLSKPIEPKQSPIPVLNDWEEYVVPVSDALCLV